jgi:TPR repeat protein
LAGHPRLCQGQVAPPQPGVSWSADFDKGDAAYKSGDYASALRELKPLAEQGHAGAQNTLGVMYNMGRGVPRNDKTAVMWYQLAPEQGHAKASTIWV